MGKRSDVGRLRAMGITHVTVLANKIGGIKLATYSEIIAGGEDGLEVMVKQRLTESVTLEFKQKSRSSHGNFEKDDKQNLGKVLSGFANSAGGICIWGVEATRNEDGIDCASRLMPISNIAYFSSEAQRLAAQYIMPRHDGIFIDRIQCLNDQESGYLVVFVERSERRPHRSEAPDDKRYYKRSAGSFIAMEHYDIEDAFRRASSATLTLSVFVRRLHPMRVGSGELKVGVQIVIELSNQGPACCKFPYVSVKASPEVYFQPYVQASFGRVFQFDGWQTRAGGGDEVLYPGHRLSVGQLTAEFWENDYGDVKVSGVSTDECSIHLRAGGDGVREASATFAIRRHEITQVPRDGKRFCLSSNPAP